MPSDSSSRESNVAPSEADRALHLFGAGEPVPPLRPRLSHPAIVLRGFVDDIDADVRRLRDAGAKFRNDIVTGPGGKQILLEDPSGNVVELFQPASH